MNITRLSWAGLMIQGPTTTLYIDPLQNVADMAPFLGQPKFPVLSVPFSTTEFTSALITHIHQDHFDQPLLRELMAESGQLFGPDPVYSAALENGLAANKVKLYETITIGDFQVTAVPAVDWIGDEQVSYVVSDGKYTILHGGDTNWHGYWWNIAKKFGPFDATFLPVNGVVGAVPGVIPASDMFGTMTPVQAVTASRILGAKTLVPMHYAQFHNAPLYNQFPDLENALDKAGAEQGIVIQRLKDGEMVA